MTGPSARWHWTRTILVATLVVGVLDGLDALIFFGLRGVSAARIFHAIAAGLIGREAARAGGLPTALLGVLLHFMVACGIVTTYYLLSRKLGFLTRYPLVCGPVYGVIAFFVMQLVVLRLSALASANLPGGEALVNGLLIHALGVGMPTALIVTRGQRGEWLPDRS